MRLLGIDIGGTNIKYIVLEDERVVETAQVPTMSEQGPEALIDRVGSLALTAGPVDAVGIAVPGVLNERGETLLVANLHGDWVGRPLAEPIQRLLSTPVAAINDGHAFTLAESTLGAGRGAASVMCVVCGTGIGGGLVLEGKLHFGAAARAGELGHQIVRPSGRLCGCGNRGCLEAHAGAHAIAESAGSSTFDAVIEAAEHGNHRALRALANAGELIGLAIANVLVFLAPERVVIGGGVAEAAPLLLDSLFSQVARCAPAAPLDAIVMCRAELGVTAGAIGAAVYAGATLGVNAATEPPVEALIGEPAELRWQDVQ
jgi:glucokinase